MSLRKIILIGSLLVIVACLLLLFSHPLSLDFFTSLIPGWHTTAYPWYITLPVILLVVALLTLLVFWAFSLIIKLLK